MEGMIARRSQMNLRERKAESNGEVIHSGHFMISSVADQDDVDDDVPHDRDSPVHHDQAIRIREGYDFSDVRKETQNTYQFGHRSTNQITIDASLSRLFECMSLAYRGGKVVSPKWKNFKGLRLSVKDKIRLNNAIWRTWHIQYIMRKRRSKISFVQFATPLDNESDCDSHSKPEAVVMEGKYWKRRIETVVAEYKKWRAFFMDKLHQSDHPGLTWVSHQSPATPETNMMDIISKQDDSMFMDLTDRLFSRLSQPFQFPNPREIAQHATNSDMMQPGLLQLQPTFDDFIDPLDALQDIFTPSRKSPAVNGTNNVSLFYSGNNSQQPSMPNHDFSNTMITSHDLSDHGIQEATLEELVQRATVCHDPNALTVSEASNIVQQQIQMRTHHEEQPQQMQVQQHHVNFGVSDPMLTQINNIVPQFSNAALPATSPMLISKQQQNTPTISQVIMARSQHQNHHPHQQQQQQSTQIQPQYQTQTKIQTAMPPPQKKAPRRRSMNKSHNNASVTVQAQNVVTPMAVQHHQQQINGTEVPMQINFQSVSPQVGSNQLQSQHHPKTAFTPTTLQHAVMNQQMANYTVSQQQQEQTNQMQVRRPPQLNTPVLTTDIIIDNMNSSTNQHVINSNSTNRKENANQNLSQVPALIVPVSIQRALASQGHFEQPPQKKQLLAENNMWDNIVVKQPSSTSASSQHIPIQHKTLLTQLLTAGAQYQAAPKQQTQATQSSLQVPVNMVVTQNVQIREDQLKRVQEQAANFNTFQNSVLMAAAQRAVVPQQQQQSIPQEAVRINLNNTNQSTTPSSTNVKEVMKRPFIKALSNQAQKGGNSVEKEDNIRNWASQLSNNKWQHQITTMDTNESDQPKEDFASVLEKSSYASVTSPASSTASSTSSDQRSHHFTAEQKRRCNIKALCDKLQEILPEISNHPSQKQVSKAVLLNKSCNHIKLLKSARQQTTTEIEQLKQRIESLNEDISNFQQQLPATGAPVSRHRGDRMQIVFDEWIRDRTLQDWKFFIFSMIIQPWFASYDQTVSVASLDELCRSCVMWLDKSCSLPMLRKGVVNSLEELGTTTSILTDPENLQQQAENAVQQGSSTLLPDSKKM
ncbi:MLX-interacting protein-like isoform X1 [Styela clava]